MSGTKRPYEPTSGANPKRAKPSSPDIRPGGTNSTKSASRERPGLGNLPGDVYGAVYPKLGANATNSLAASSAYARRLLLPWCEEFNLPAERCPGDAQYERGAPGEKRCRACVVEDRVVLLEWFDRAMTTLHRALDPRYSRMKSVRNAVRRAVRDLDATPPLQGGSGVLKTRLTRLQRQTLNFCLRQIRFGRFEGLALDGEEDATFQANTKEAFYSYYDRYDFNADHACELYNEICIISADANTAEIKPCEFRNAERSILGISHQEDEGPLTLLGYVAILPGIKAIGSEAFRDCSDLTSVYIPSSVSFIGAGAFKGCFALKSVNIPHRVRKIEPATFMRCFDLTSMHIAYGVTKICRSAFAACSSLKSVTIPDSVEEIGYDAFFNCASLESVNIPHRVRRIEPAAFMRCSDLTSMHIAYGVTEICRSAFAGCSSLKSVTIPDSVEEIGHGAFLNCSSLESVNIGNSVTRIAELAFGDCTALASVVISVETVYIPFGPSASFPDGCVVSHYS